MVAVPEAARRLYAETLVWDDHAGFAPDPDAGLSGLARWRAAGVSYLSVNVGYDVMTWQETVRALAGYRRWIETHGDELILVRSTDDILAAKRHGRLAVGFDIEGANALNGDADMVGLYHALGVRQLLFAYNLKNAAGGGCHDEDVGLTGFGRQVVAEMNRVGMLVDVAHCSYRTSMDAIACSDRPVVFSHANPRALHDHPRNIRDDQIRACAATGGVIGINGLGLFLGKDGDIRSATIARHIDYVARLVGPRHVGIGLDFVYEEQVESAFPPDRRDYWPEAHGYYRPGLRFAGPEQLPEVAAALLGLGYAEPDVRAVLGGNFLRVARAVWG